jgi:hypothetical protein
MICSPESKEFKILTKFMSPKKLHEVLYLTNCIEDNMANLNCKTLFDFGSGKVFFFLLLLFTSLQSTCLND